MDRCELKKLRRASFGSISVWKIRWKHFRAAPQEHTQFLQLFDNFGGGSSYNDGMKNALCLLGAVAWLAGSRAAADPKWAVHEWGTFTALQDESGDAIGGINTDDEPVPPFVHRLDAFVVLSPSEVPGNYFQGAPSCHPDVTMRLETPVIYFHPPQSAVGVQTARVRVTFRGGWLSEFYPAADLAVPGLENGRFQFGRLLAETESKLTWNDLKIGGDWPVTDTSARVWTAPRAVQSASVRTTGGESEKFLFYRGVAHIDAPLRVSRDALSGELQFRSQLAEMPLDRPLRIDSLWLVDIRPGGKIAFRPLPALSLDHAAGKPLMRTPADFAPADFAPGNLDKLKATLRSALAADGLFDDEARALLNTWELSYFKSTGLRVFFLVPRAWTDFYLPLEISQPADVNRVMVGRIELVTPSQRKILREISGFSTYEILQDAVQLQQNYFRRYLAGARADSGDSGLSQLHREMAQVNAGQKALSSVVSVPKTYQTYLNLGRFRNALVLETLRGHPTEGLTNFIATYRLQAYQPAAAPARL